MKCLTAFVLAGGRSTRMGADKALLELAGTPLIAHAVVVTRSVSEEVKIIGDPAKYSRFGDVVEDVFPGHGPLGGIHAALLSSPTEWNLALGVDMPFLNERFLKWLVSHMTETDALVIVPQAKGHLQPLCAMYRKPFVEVAEKALKEGRNKIDALFSHVSTRIIAESEIIVAGFDSSIFRNLNTPEEWHAAEREISASSLDL